MNNLETVESHVGHSTAKIHVQGILEWENIDLSTYIFSHDLSQDFADTVIPFVDVPSAEVTY